MRENRDSERASPIVVDAGGRFPPERRDGGRMFLAAMMLSFGLHGGLTALVTLTRQRAVSTPTIEVSEAIPVEIVADPERLRARAATGLPLSVLRAERPPPASAIMRAAPEMAAPARLEPLAPVPGAAGPEAALPIPQTDPERLGPASPDRLAAATGPPRLAAVAAASGTSPAALATPDDAIRAEVRPETRLDSAGIAPDARLDTSPSPLERLAPDVPPVPERVARAEAERQRPISSDAISSGSEPSAAAEAKSSVPIVIPPSPVSGVSAPVPSLTISAAPVPAEADSAEPAAVSGSAAPLAKVAAVGAALRPFDDSVAPLRPVVPLDPRPAVASLITGLPCARIGAVTDDATGAVTLKGHARSETDRQRLAASLSALPGVTRVDASALGIVGEPYCRVLGLLDRPDLRRSAEQRHDLATLGAPNAPGLRRAVGGQALQLTLSAPDFDAHLYVDYFSADGGVVHLLPAQTGDNRLRADSVFKLGESGRRAVIGPPYGLDVVVVIASSEPLFGAPRQAQESAAAYLPLLDREIARVGAAGRARFEYAYYLLQTVPP